MRVVGESGVEFELEDTVATSMIASGHLGPVDPDAVEATATGVTPSDADRIGHLEERVAALEARLAAGTDVEHALDEGDGNAPAEDAPSTAEGSAPASGEQSGPVKDGEPETGPATDEAQDILHDTKPSSRRTRKSATDES